MIGRLKLKLEADNSSTIFHRDRQRRVVAVRSAAEGERIAWNVRLNEHSVTKPNLNI